MSISFQELIQTLQGKIKDGVKVIVLPIFLRNDDSNLDEKGKAFNKELKILLKSEFCSCNIIFAR